MKYTNYDFNHELSSKLFLTLITLITKEMRDSITIFQHSNPCDEPCGEPEARRIDLANITDIEFDDVDTNDYPDFCDAFICSANMAGFPMTEEELNELNERFPEFVYEKLISHLY